MGKMYIKQQIVQENPELVLSENGDFIIDKSLVDVRNSNVPTKQTKKEVMTQTLAKFEKVLAYITDATVILAHGGSFDFPYIIDILKKYPNTYTDISLQPSENIKQIIGEVGSDRILFGTDYPFLNHAFSMLSVLRATTDEEERKNIFSDNAKKILHL